MYQISELFQSICKMSLTVSYVVMIVLIARLFLQKCPRRFSYILWGLVFIRLICPVFPQSTFSIITEQSVIQQRSSTIQTVTLPTSNTLVDNTTNITSDTEEIQIYIDDTTKQKIEPISVISLIWILGVLILWVYHIQSYLRMKKYLRGATEVEPNIYEWNGNPLSFAHGIISPKIYLSRNTSPNSRNMIICHEQVHLKRRDYIVKAACLMISCVHCFNPLVWLSYFLMNNDMEISCDEEVVRLLGEENKSTY